MTRFSVVSAVLASLLFALAPAAMAQGSGDESSPWSFGAGIGLGVNEPTESFDEPFDHCAPTPLRPAGSLSVGYSALSWLDLRAAGSVHEDFEGDCPLQASPPDHVSTETAGREYPGHIRDGPSYLATEVRLLVHAPRTSRSIRPVLLAGLGRIWDKRLSYPTLGLGAEVPMGAFDLRLVVTGRMLSVPYDRVTYESVPDDRATYEPGPGVAERSRVRLSDEHFPVLFRIGLDWRP